MFHTATALRLGPGQTQVTMFGGSPKLKVFNPQGMAETTVLEFGEQDLCVHAQSDFAPEAVHCLTVLQYHIAECFCKAKFPWNHDQFYFRKFFAG